MRQQAFEQQGDDELVAIIQHRESGWQRALSVLLLRHHEGLLWHCQSRLGNKQDAEDAVQESILRAHRGMAGFKGDAAFRTWLHAIAEHQCNTLAVRRGRHLLADHLRERIVLHERLRLRQAPAVEHRQRVHETLAGLPQASRDVLMLRFFNELSIEQIAHTLGIGLSAAKMRLYRALEQFAAEYAQTPTPAG